MILMKMAWYVFFSLVAAYSLLTVARIIFTFNLLDFSVYHSASVYFLHGQNPYTPLPNNMHFVYPPPAVLLLSWVGVLPLGVAENVWTVLSFLSLLFSIYLLIKSQIGLVQPFTFLLIFSFSILAFPTRFTLGLGQVNMFVLLLLSLCMYCSTQKRDYWSGFFLSLAALIKIFPAILLLLLVKEKNGKAMGAFAITCGTLVAASFLLLGKEGFFGYFTDILPHLPTVGNDSYYNQSLTGFLARAGVSNQLAEKMQFLTLLVSLLLSFVWLKKPQPNTLSLQAGLLITLWLIAGGLTWQHHLVLLLIPFTALYLHISTQVKQFWWEMGLLFLSYCLVAYNIRQPDTMPLQPLLLSHGLWGMGILVGLLVYEMKKSSKHSKPEN
jgi:hypothetical protein